MHTRPADTPVYLTARQVCARFGGISDMTLWRWLQNPAIEFAHPIVIAKRRYWRIADLEAWERKRATEQGEGA